MQNFNNRIILLIALAFALILISFAIRLFGFSVTGNVALGMETAHIIVDFVLTFFVIVVIKVTRSKFGQSFSFGLFKLEDLISFFIALVVLYVGIDFLIAGLTSSPSLSFAASLYQLVSIVPLFFAGYLKVRSGDMIHSNSLKADGRHTYTDVYEGAGVALGLLAYSFTHIMIFYLIAVLLAFIVLLITGFSIARDSLLSLLDLPKSKTTKYEIEKIVSTIQGVERVKDTKIRWSGPMIFVELVVEMNPLMTIDEAHPITEVIENKIKEKIEDVYSVVVHIEPVGRSKFKILVPVESKSIDSKISDVLARSRYFAMVEINGNEKKLYHIENPLINQKSHVAPSFKDFLIKNSITDLICKEIGDSVYGLLLAYDIFCWHAKASTLSENIELFENKKLEKMSKHLVKKHTSSF